MRIQNNVPAINAHRYYGINQTNTQKSIAKLSSGYRINSAADDAAGLAISEKMRAQIRGLTMASKNTQDAVSLIQTAEGGMQEIDNMLQRVRELLVYASNDTQEHNTLGTGDRQKIQDEIDQLVEEIDSMAERVEFNKKKIISGEFAGSDAVSSTTIARLQEAYVNSTKAKAQASAAMNQAGENYKTFATKATTYNAATASPLEKALVDFFGSSSAMTVSGNYSAGSDDDTVGTLTAAEYYATGNTAMASSVMGGLANILKDIGVAATALTSSGIKDALSAVLAEPTNGQAVVVDFKNFLATLGISSSNGLQSAINGAVAQNSVWGGAASAVVSSMLSLDVFGIGAAASGYVFAKTDSLDDITAIANYTDKNGQLLTEDIQKIVDAAKKVVDAVDAYKEYTKEGGVFETGKKTFEAAAKAEGDLRAEYESKKADWAIKKSESSAAKTKLDAAIALNGATNAKSEGLYFQVGANADQHLQLTIGSVKSDILGIGDGTGKTDIDVLKATGADITKQLNDLDTALSYVTTERSKLGAAQNRLEYTMNSLEISAENLQSAESRIRDVDMAKEMTTFTKQNILFQASIAMLAQANAFPQGVLQLLG
jgi:flagellin